MFASVAQLVEQRIRNAWVEGSNPFGSFFYYIYINFSFQFTNSLTFTSIKFIIQYNNMAIKHNIDILIITISNLNT